MTTPIRQGNYAGQTPPVAASAVETHRQAPAPQEMRRRAIGR